MRFIILIKILLYQNDIDGLRYRILRRGIYGLEILNNIPFVLKSKHKFSISETNYLFLWSPKIKSQGYVPFFPLQWYTLTPAWISPTSWLTNWGNERLNQPGLDLDTRFWTWSWCCQGVRYLCTSADEYILYVGRTWNTVGQKTDCGSQPRQWPPESPLLVFHTLCRLLLCSARVAVDKQQHMAELMLCHFKEEVIKTVTPVLFFSFHSLFSSCDLTVRKQAAMFWAIHGEAQLPVHWSLEPIAREEQWRVNNQVSEFSPSWAFRCLQSSWELHSAVPWF